MDRNCGAAGFFKIKFARHNPVTADIIWQSVLAANPYEPPRANSEVATPVTVEPWPDRHRKRFLLAAVPALSLPISYIVVVASGIFWGFPVPPVLASIGLLGLIGTAIQLPIYLIWAFISPELSVTHKIIWGVVLILINMFGIPMFLYAKYRRQTATTWSANKA